MARLVKCPYCEDKLDKDEAHEYKKRYYHADCFSKWQREGQDYKDLTAYISELYGVEYPSLVIKKQVKDMKEDGYKYKGMELALRYFFETLGNRVQENTGVGIIPYVYEDAKNHYIKQLKIAESIQSAGENEEVTVYIDSNKNKRNSRKIDITAI